MRPTTGCVMMQRSYVLHYPICIYLSSSVDANQSLLHLMTTGVEAGTRICVIPQRPSRHPPSAAQPRPRRVVRAHRQLLSCEIPIHLPLRPTAYLQPISIQACASAATTPLCIATSRGFAVTEHDFGLEVGAIPRDLDERATGGTTRRLCRRIAQCDVGDVGSHTIYVRL
jgi:hypothetical protein